MSFAAPLALFAFLLCRAASQDYKYSGWQEYCDGDNHEIPTEKECHEAAIALGVAYWYTGSWPGEHKNCYYGEYGGQMQIFFNSAGPNAAATPPNPQTLSICRTQEAAMYETPDHKYRQDKLWTDPDFPPDSRSLGQGLPDLEWVRAMDLNRGRDDFLYDTVSAYDPGQGALGDCWLVAALSSAAHHPQVISEMFTLDDPNIEGWYQLWFWDIRLGQEGGPAGKWSLVTIDDFIPVAARGHALRGTPYMTKARTDGELWPALLEKAFAKFSGSYEALDGGWSTWAWQAMGVCSDIHEYSSNAHGSAWDLHTVDVDAQRREMGQGNRRAETRRFVSTITHDDVFDRLSGRIYGVLAGASCCRAELGCGADNFAEGTFCDGYGLVAGHAYSLLMAMQVQIASGTEKLLLLRNPWANDKVYRGDWGPFSKKWDENPEAKQQVEAAMNERNHAGDDGVWWMSLSDFNYFFDGIEECVLSEQCVLSLSE